VHCLGGATPAATSWAKINDFVQSRHDGQRDARRDRRANGFPSRQVIAFCGDGGLSMLMGDLITIVSQKLPIKIIVFNNSTLGMVRLEQMVGGYPFWGTEMHNPDFSAVAKAIGFHAERVERKADIAPAIERAFAHPGPALLDITTDPDAMSMPPKSTYEEAKGFALAMTRMVMDHRSDQVLELVKDNIRGMV
jgi:pyruvate dehydrogenase (quinone)